MFKFSLLRVFHVCLLSTIPFAIPACANSNEISLVKNGKLSTCPSRTVSQLFDGAIDNQKWELDTSKSDKPIVSVTGVLSNKRDSSNYKFGFLLNKDRSGFNFELFEIDGKNEGMALGLGMLIGMCNRK